MKKLFITIITCLVTLNSFAQIIRVEELGKYAMLKYGDDWEAAATNLSSQLTLDKNNALTYSQIIPAEGKTKDQLYVLLNYWFASTFNDANSVIQLNDKESGTIIAQGYVADIAQHIGGYNRYNVSIKPVIKVDIKDFKIRVTYTVPFYSVVKIINGGILGSKPEEQVRSDENWVIDKCFPFVQKDSHKKTSSKALVMTHAYSNVVMDKIEECVKNGMTGNEDDDW